MTCFGVRELAPALGWVGRLDEIDCTRPPSADPKAAASCRTPKFVLLIAILLLSSAASHAVCTGDCNRDDAVTIDELLSGVNISLGSADMASCPDFDRNGDGSVSVDELIAAVGSALDGCALPQTRAFVVTTDFTTGSFATIDLDPPHTVMRSSPNHRVHRDAVVRTHDNLVYVVNRLFADNLQVLDPADQFATRLECSTGNGTNPHDIAFAGDDKAYITLFERSTLLIVDPAAPPNCDGFTRGTIDLSSLADADGNPDMDQMAIVDTRLYVALERLDINTVLRIPATNGALAVIDTTSDEVIGAIELTGQNPFAATKGLTVRDGGIYVAETGLFNVLDGGIERVDLATQQAQGYVITEEELGGDITDFVFITDHLAYAVIGRPNLTNALVAFDPSTRQITSTLLDVRGFSLFDIELNDRGELYVADRARRASGIRIFRAADGAPLTDAPLDLLLPPFEIVFIP
jgi:hypothetical protein